MPSSFMCCILEMRFSQMYIYAYIYVDIYEELFSKTWSSNLSLALQTNSTFRLALIAFWKRALRIYTTTKVCCLKQRHKATQSYCPDTEPTGINGHFTYNDWYRQVKWQHMHLYNIMVCCLNQRHHTTQSHYPDTEPMSSYPILIMQREHQARKRQVSILKSLVWLDQGWNPCGFRIRTHEVRIPQSPSTGGHPVWCLTPKTVYDKMSHSALSYKNFLNNPPTRCVLKGN